MKLSKRRNVILNILVSLADSLVISYVLMFLTWLVRGMRVGLEGCVRIWAVYYILCAGIMIIISFGLAALRRGELRDITDRMFDKGCDDEYFRLLKEYMGGELLPSQQLVFASCYLEAGRMEDCRRELEKVDFAALSAPEQEEYFNVCLYSAVLEENVELANEIYRKAKHYLDRAV
ncbi:MAG: hypothetical protein IJ555_00135, partial [Ruminococcus sp.]|nr:hypothetical protein [Ruminococcus sp.]